MTPARRSPTFPRAVGLDTASPRVRSPSAIASGNSELGLGLLASARLRGPRESWKGASPPARCPGLGSTGKENGAQTAASRC